MVFIYCFLLPSQAGGRAELSASFSGGAESCREGGATGSAASSQCWQCLRQAEQPNTEGTFRQTHSILRLCFSNMFITFRTFSTLQVSCISYWNSTFFSKVNKDVYARWVMYYLIFSQLSPKSHLLLFSHFHEMKKLNCIIHLFWSYYYFQGVLVSTEEKLKGLQSEARQLKSTIKKHENLVEKYKKKVQLLSKLQAIAVMSCGFIDIWTYRKAIPCVYTK